MSFPPAIFPGNCALGEGKCPPHLCRQYWTLALRTQNPTLPHQSRWRPLSRVPWFSSSRQPFRPHGPPVVCGPLVTTDLETSFKIKVSRLVPIPQASCLTSQEEIHGIVLSACHSSPRRSTNTSFGVFPWSRVYIGILKNEQSSCFPDL